MIKCIASVTGFISYELSVLTKSVFPSERFVVFFDLVDYFGDGSALNDFLSRSYEEKVDWALEQIQTDNSDLPNLLEVYIDRFRLLEDESPLEALA